MEEFTEKELKCFSLYGVCKKKYLNNLHAMCENAKTCTKKIDGRECCDLSLEVTQKIAHKLIMKIRIKLWQKLK